ncbi:hypothetical protein QVD99_001673 [Batrachochytrium dendrobatidis]|nr:hypothetical protein O5D80_000320 [Batrachochytrium dendrobatidis]KAK5671842.1 hypothetical protein QVD99_001673 [Batrachochytrium dendrobatidis]
MANSAIIARRWMSQPFRINRLGLSLPCQQASFISPASSQCHVFPSKRLFSTPTQSASIQNHSATTAHNNVTMVSKTTDTRRNESFGNDTLGTVVFTGKSQSFLVLTKIAVMILTAGGAALILDINERANESPAPVFPLYLAIVGVVGTILVGTTIVNKSYVIKIIRPLPTYVASPVVSSMIRNQSANKIIRSGLQPVASSTLHIQTQTWFNLVKTHTINISDLRCRSSGVIRTWMHLPGSPNSRGPLIFPLLAKRFILEVGPDSSLDSELKCILDTVKVNSGMTVIPDQRVSIEPDSTESTFKR